MKHFWPGKSIVERLHFFNDKPFFDFLVTEHGFKNVKIFELQKLRKVRQFFLLDFNLFFIRLKLQKKVVVEKYFTVKVGRKERIGVLDKVDCHF